MPVPKELVQTETASIDLVDAVVAQAQQLATQIDMADELAKRAGEALAARLQPHITGQSVITAAMRQISAQAPASIDVALPQGFVEALEIKALEVEEDRDQVYGQFAEAMAQTRRALGGGSPDRLAIEAGGAEE